MYNRVWIEGFIDDMRVKQAMEFATSDAESIRCMLKDRLHSGSGSFAVVDVTGMVFSINLARAKVINLSITDITT